MPISSSEIPTAPAQGTPDPVCGRAPAEVSDSVASGDSSFVGLSTSSSEGESVIVVVTVSLGEADELLGEADELVGVADPGVDPVSLGVGVSLGDGALQSSS